MGKEVRERLARGRYLLYRRPANGGCGVWRARWWSPVTQKSVERSLGSADDFQDADGIEVLTFAQASNNAGNWFDERDRVSKVEIDGLPLKLQTIFKVKDAISLYLQDAENEGNASKVRDIGTTARNHILPAFGEKEIEKLTVEEIKAWHADLAKAPRRKTGWKGRSEEGAWGEGGPTEEQLRARKNTANRILAVFKRALNLSVELEKVSGERTPWSRVKPFKKVAGVRLRFLTANERQLLVNAASEEFRPLLIGALYTGSRYAPLTRMLVKDFNPEVGTIYIQRDKGEKDRHIVLQANAIAWFKMHTQGRDGGELMFRRKADLKRRTRVDGGLQWLQSDQQGQLEKACKAAKLDPLSFHELRHTYASDLTNKGVPLVFVAAQLGHADTRMVEKHYGHLCNSALAMTIRNSDGDDFGGGEPKVESLQVKQGA